MCINLLANWRLESLQIFCYRMSLLITISKEMELKRFLSASDKSQIRREDRESKNLSDFYSILDNNFICNLAFMDSKKVLNNIPLLYARIEDEIFIHGSTGSRIFIELKKGIDITLSVFEFNGMVMAKSAFESSVNYRSVVIFGKSKSVPDSMKEKYSEILTDKIFPLRTAEIRKSTKKELASTSIMSISILDASVKLRTGPPLESELDKESKVWSGVIPFKLIAERPVPSDDFSKSSSLPKSVQKILRIYN